MKKLILTTSTACILFACGGESTTTSTPSPELKSDSTIEKICKKGYDVDNTTIGFGGFKTTERKEVKGIFQEFKVKDTKVADTHEEVFSSATFSIPVSSIETKDIARNKRLKEEYFGSMESTHLIKGKVVEFNSDSNTVVFNIKMNNIKKDVVLDYVISGDTITLTGSIDILDFDGSGAIKALNEVCGSLHTGADGETKTWSDVNLYISSILKETCE